ncbi:MAG: S-layer protein [Candidatus Methanofastidiosia archaeon]
MLFLSVMPFTLNVASTSSGTLPDNDFFVDPETGAPNILIVVGSKAAAADVVSAAMISAQVGATFFRDNPVDPEELVVLDESITDEMKEYNLLLVGGPIANDIVNELVDLGLTTVEYWEASPGETAIFHDVFVEGKDVCVVAGSDRVATYSAALELISSFPERTYTPPQTPTETPPPETTPPPSEIEATLHAGQEFDLDQGVENGPVPDIFWEVIIKPEKYLRYLTPRTVTGAALANLGTDVDFESIDLDYAVKATYSEEYINASTTYNLIPEGTVLLCKTGRGNYIKMIIDGFQNDEKDIVFRYEILGRVGGRTIIYAREPTFIDDCEVTVYINLYQNEIVVRVLDLQHCIIQDNTILLGTTDGYTITEYPSEIELSDRGTTITFYKLFAGLYGYCADITIQYFESEE